MTVGISMTMGIFHLLKSKTLSVVEETFEFVRRK